MELTAGDFITLQAERLTSNTIINETTLSIIKLEGGQGAQGVQGIQGDKGDPGDPGPSTDSDSYIIDADDTANLQILSFGSSLTKTLTFDVINDWFNLTERLNIGGDGTVDGLKLTTRASATDSNANQIEIRNNSNIAVFAVDEDGDISASGSMDIKGDINFNQNEAKNMALENLATAPSAPVNGQIFFNTSDNKTYVWDGTTWINIIPEISTGSTLAAVQARRTTTFTPPALNTWYNVDLDTTDIETNSGAIVHNILNRSNIDILENGLYQITYTIESLSDTVSHELNSRILLNNTTMLNGSFLSNHDYQLEHIPSSANFLAELNAGDFITLQAERTTANEVINETIVTVVKLNNAGPK